MFALAGAAAVVIGNVATGGDLVDQWFRGATGLFETATSELAETATSAPAEMTWDCVWDPTMNDNWHDDVICWRGAESVRPILLDGQFVTEADMIAAGEAYEAQLNG